MILNNEEEAAIGPVLRKRTVGERRAYLQGFRAGAKYALAQAARSVPIAEENVEAMVRVAERMSAEDPS